MRALVGSRHMVTIRPAKGPSIAANVLVRDRRHHLGAKISFVCFGPGCANRTWPTEAALLASHATPPELERNREVHVYAGWSDDPVDGEADPADHKPLGLISVSEYDTWSAMP